MNAPAAWQVYQPAGWLVTGWRHRQLIARLAWRNIQARYRGSALGLLWPVITPLLMLAVYTFVFSVVFEARWGPPDQGRFGFALFLFSGLILYSIFSECINEAPDLVRRNQTFVKQLSFPVEVLSWVSVVCALFNFSIGLAVLAAFRLAEAGHLDASWLYLPLVVAPMALLALGVGWWVSSVGVFVRDTSQITGIATTALLFLSPIFYPMERVPASIIDYYRLNPMATILETSKDVLFLGSPPETSSLAGVTAACWIVAWTGHAWFMKTKKSFANVL